MKVNYRTSYTKAVQREVSSLSSLLSVIRADFNSLRLRSIEEELAAAKTEEAKAAAELQTINSKHLRTAEEARQQKELLLKCTGAAEAAAKAAAEAAAKAEDPKLTEAKAKAARKKAAEAKAAAEAAAEAAAKAKAARLQRTTAEAEATAELQAASRVYMDAKRKAARLQSIIMEAKASAANSASRAERLSMLEEVKKQKGSAAKVAAADCEVSYLKTWLPLHNGKISDIKPIKPIDEAKFALEYKQMLETAKKSLLESGFKKSEEETEEAAAARFESEAVALCPWEYFTRKDGTLCRLIPVMDWTASKVFSKILAAKKFEAEAAAKAKEADKQKREAEAAQAAEAAEVIRLFGSLEAAKKFAEEAAKKREVAA